MPRNKHSSQSYEERLQALNPKNRLYVERFLKTKHRDQPSYKSQIFRFVKHFNDVPIDQIGPEEIERYFSQPGLTPEHAEGIIPILRFFLKLIPSQKANIACLTEIAKKKREEIKRNEEPITISLGDVITFRNKLISERDYKTLFVFEMLYIYGVKWEDLENITTNSYSFSTGELEVRSKGRIKLIESLRNVIDQYPEVLRPKKYSTLADYLHDASTDFEHSITETVIETTRNKYFPVCQRCNCRYPNTSEYWALVECKEDAYHKKWLLCVSCANEVGRR